jgi:hypothetical protein
MIMTLDQRLRDAADDAHQAVSGRRPLLNPVSAPAVGGRRAVAVLVALGVAAALTVTSLVMRGGPTEVPVGNADPTSTAVTDGGPTPTLPAPPMPEAPFLSPDLGFELDPEERSLWAGLEPFIANARSGAVPVELYGDIWVAYQAAVAIVELEPMRYELRDLRESGILPVRFEAGHFLIRGESDTLVIMDSQDVLSADPGWWGRVGDERWGTLRVSAGFGTLSDWGQEVAVFSVFVPDGDIWTKQVSVWFTPIDGGLLPLSEELMRQVAAAIFEALSGT